METKKILIVDDDIDIITVVKAILSKEGYTVISIKSRVLKWLIKKNRTWPFLMS
jgi:CheY-like chemotaxis protein